MPNHSGEEIMKALVNEFNKLVKSSPLRPYQKKDLSEILDLSKALYSHLSRSDGLPYFSHPLRAAISFLLFHQDFLIWAFKHKTHFHFDILLSDLYHVLSAILLHDVLEDVKDESGNSMTAEKLTKLLDDKKIADSKSIVALVLRVTKPTTPESGSHDKNLENLEALRQLFTTYGHNGYTESARKQIILGLLVKFPDREDNSATFVHFSASRREKAREKAAESLRWYAPIALRLGWYEYQRRIEENSFFSQSESLYIDYSAKATHLREKYLKDIPAFITKTFQALGIHLSEEDQARITDNFKDVNSSFSPVTFGGITLQLSTRRLYSVHKQMLRLSSQLPIDQRSLMEHVNRELAFDDFFKLIVIAKARKNGNSEDACYQYAGRIHKAFGHLQVSFNDYISNRKSNGYRSLHTRVPIQATDPRPIQVLIRTKEMDLQARYGVLMDLWQSGSDPARWANLDGWLKPLSELADRGKADWAEHVLKHIESVGDDQLAAVLSDGQRILLPEGSILADLGYAVTQLNQFPVKQPDYGHCVIGATDVRTNMTLTSLDILRPEMVIRILVYEGQEPSPKADWLPHLRTPTARENVINYFIQKGSHGQNEIAEAGKRLLDARLRAEGLEAMELINEESLRTVFNSDSQEAFFNQICGKGANSNLEPISVEEAIRSLREYRKTVLRAEIEQTSLVTLANLKRCLSELSLVTQGSLADFGLTLGPNMDRKSNNAIVKLCPECWPVPVRKHGKPAEIAACFSGSAGGPSDNIQLVVHTESHLSSLRKTDTTLERALVKANVNGEFLPFHSLTALLVDDRRGFGEVMGRIARSRGCNMSMICSIPLKSGLSLPILVLSVQSREDLDAFFKEVVTNELCMYDVHKAFPYNEGKLSTWLTAVALKIKSIGL